MGYIRLYENVQMTKQLIKNNLLIRTAAKNKNLDIDDIIVKNNELYDADKKIITINDIKNEYRNIIRNEMDKIELDDIKLKQHIENDVDYNKLKKLLEKNLGYLYMFYYFRCVEMVGYDEIENAYKDLLEYKDLLHLMPKKIDHSFIDPNIPNNFEKLIDGLNIIKNYRKVKKIYDRLTPELKNSYKTAPENIKNEFESIAIAFNDNIGIDSNTGKVDPELNKKILSMFFGELRQTQDGGYRYYGQLKRYKNINDFIKAAKSFIDSVNTNNVSDFYKKIDDVNRYYGIKNGAEIVFDKNGILILKINSFNANRRLNGDTSHCIKDSKSSWDTYVTNINGVQYYIYNFNLSLTDKKSVIGITITKDSYNMPQIRACHLKDDTNYKNNIQDLLKQWEKEYDINDDLFSYLKPITDDEIEYRKKLIEIENDIIKNYNKYTIEDIKRVKDEYCIDVNVGNGVLLTNAIKKNDHEMVEELLKMGADPNINKTNKIIHLTDDFNMILILIKYGAEITDLIYKKYISNYDAIKKIVEINPNSAIINAASGIRYACIGSYKNKNNPGKPYIKQFKLLLDAAGDRVKNEKILLPILSISTSYGRLEILKYLIDEKKYVNDKKMIEYCIEIAKESEDVPKTDIDATIKYLEDVLSRMK